MPPFHGKLKVRIHIYIYIAIFINLIEILRLRRLKRKGVTLDFFFSKSRKLILYPIQISAKGKGLSKLFYVFVLLSDGVIT